jgi:hypothetical protein
MALSATVDNPTASVLLFADYSAEVGAHATVTVERIDASGTRTPVRGAVEAQMLGEQFYVYDYEAPLDVPVTYESTSDLGVVYSAGPVTIVSDGYVWFKDPGRPWANFRLDFCSQVGVPCPDIMDPISVIRFGDATRAADATLPGVLNAERPADIYARRKDVVTSIQFASKTLEAITTIYELFTAGGPLLIQAPAAYGWPDRYYQPEGLEEEYVGLDQRKPWRLWNVPLIVVDAPSYVPGSQGTLCANWCLVEDTFPTFADMTATTATWGDLLDGGTPLC